MILTYLCGSLIALFTASIQVAGIFTSQDQQEGTRGTKRKRRKRGLREGKRRDQEEEGTRCRQKNGLGVKVYGLVALYSLHYLYLLHYKSQSCICVWMV
jgi:hypothetical protein